MHLIHLHALISRLFTVLDNFMVSFCYFQQNWKKLKEVKQPLKKLKEKLQKLNSVACRWRAAMWIHQRAQSAADDAPLLARTAAIWPFLGVMGNVCWTTQRAFIRSSLSCTSHLGSTLCKPSLAVWLFYICFFVFLYFFWLVFRFSLFWGKKNKIFMTIFSLLSCLVAEKCCAEKRKGKGVNSSQKVPDLFFLVEKSSLTCMVMLSYKENVLYILDNLRVVLCFGQI